MLSQEHELAGYCAKYSGAINTILECRLILF
jgi:hypothetical protein